MSKQFKDFIGSVQMQILEDASDGRMVVKGVFQRADTKNANGRIYSSALWEKLLSDEKLETSLKSRMMLGCVEHPSSQSTDLSEVSHVITNLTRKGNEIIGEAEVLDTPKGKIIKELFRAGCAVGISSRGRGTSYHRNGVEYVDESSFVLDTFDFVYKPSTPGAYPELQESIQKALGPYNESSEMSAKIDELKRLEVRSSDILRECSAANLETLKQLNLNATEILESVKSLANSINESEEDGDYAKEVLEKVSSTKSRVAELLESKMESDSTRTDFEVDSLINEWDDEEDEEDDEDDEEDEKDPKAKKSKKESSKVSRALELVNKLRESRDFYKSRYEDLSQHVETDTKDLVARLEAAYAVGNELTSRINELTSTFDEAIQEYETLEERHTAALSILSEMSERHERGRIIRRVREAFERNPELSKFQKQFLRCESVEEVDELINDFEESLGLKKYSKEEALTQTVAFNPELLESLEEVEEAPEEDGYDSYPTGENSELPSVNESIDYELSPQKSTSREISMVEKMREKYGWK
jgi:hypothetical protein